MFSEVFSKHGLKLMKIPDSSNVFCPELCAQKLGQKRCVFSPLSVLPVLNTTAVEKWKLRVHKAGSSTSLA